MPQSEFIFIKAKNISHQIISIGQFANFTLNQFLVAYYVSKGSVQCSSLLPISSQGLSFTSLNILK